VLTLLALGVAGVMAASEITASWTLKAVKSGVTYLNEVSSKSLTLNASSPTVSRYTKTVTTNEAVALDVPVLNGWCWLENTSTNTNDVVQVGVVDVNTNFLPLLMLKATESCPVRICTNITPYAKAITGTNATSIVLKQPILDD